MADECIVCYLIYLNHVYTTQWYDQIAKAASETFLSEETFADMADCLSAHTFHAITQLNHATPDNSRLIRIVIQLLRVFTRLRCQTLT